ncbi:MAG: putative lipid II flippase FtsW [Rhodoferax sp.]|nr:putative lipid II flippase FtsW [Rhodoferax sp.]
MSAIAQTMKRWLSRCVGSVNSAVALPVRLGGQRTFSTPVSAPSVRGIDQTLIGVVVALLLWGVVMVYSASIAIPNKPGFDNYTHSHFLARQLFAIAVAFGLALLAFRVPMESWARIAPYLFIAALLLLILVLFPMFGKEVNDARRWLALGGLNFQPSELAKFAMVLYAAGYMVRKMDVKESFVRAILPMGLALVVIGLLLLAEPDMGAFMVIAVIAIGILFLGGVNMRMFLVIAGILIVVFCVVIAFSDWRRERIFAYLDPWNPRYTLDKSYQLTHALIAIGRGGWFGVGLGGSVEKLHWLPEAHTDFLLAVIGEEFGLLGVLCVIGLFLWLTRRIILIGRQAIALDRVFSGLVAEGIGLWMGFQAFINMGVNLGALPTKGLTLPLMSYGGSAILVNVVALAVVLRIDVESRQLMRGGRL